MTHRIDFSEFDPELQDYRIEVDLEELGAASREVYAWFEFLGLIEVEEVE